VWCGRWRDDNIEDDSGLDKDDSDMSLKDIHAFWGEMCNPTLIHYFPIVLMMMMMKAKNGITEYLKKVVTTTREKEN